MYSHGTHHSNRQNLRHSNYDHTYYARCVCVRVRFSLTILANEFKRLNGKVKTKTKKQREKAWNWARKRGRTGIVTSIRDNRARCDILWLMKWIKVNAKRRNILSKAIPMKLNYVENCFPLSFLPHTHFLYV